MATNLGRNIAYLPQERLHFGPKIDHSERDLGAVFAVDMLNGSAAITPIPQAIRLQD
jgi:hypothetical protein